MRLAAWTALLWCVARTTLLAGAQVPSATHPSLAGRWVQSGQPQPTVGLPPICGRGCTITQSADAITVNGALGSSIYDWTRALALTSKTNTDVITTTVTAIWRDQTLVITLTSRSSASTQLSTVANLQLQGDELVISGTRPSPTGEISPFEVVYRREPLSRVSPGPF